MMQADQDTSTFLSLLEDQFRQFPDDTLKKIRSKAWDLFHKIGLPAKNHELFRYLRLRHFFSQHYVASNFSKLTPQDIEKHLLPECRHSCLVFVNGHYQPTLSRTEKLPQRLVISSLSEAATTYSALLTNQWNKTWKEESDPFAAVNAALHRDGIFLYVPPKTTFESPLQLLHIIDVKQQPMLMMPRLHLFVGALAELTLASTHVKMSGENYAINQVSDLHLEDGASVKFFQMNQHDLDHIWHLDALRAHLKQNSTLKVACVTNGSGTIRQDYRVSLAGENATAALNGLCMLEGKREAHTNVLIEHQAPHCLSNQLFKSVLNDTSRSSFEGKIFVDQIAQKTQAYQLNANLLLSDTANAFSKPNLEIFADDVKASHGATIGQLDREQLFYMQTKGLDILEAKKLLIDGFCKDVIDRISIDSLRKRYEKQL